MFKSLSNKLMFSFLLIILITMLALGISTSELFTDYYYNVQEQELTDRGKRIASVMQKHMQQNKSPEEILAAAGGIANAKVVWVHRQALILVLNKNRHLQRPHLNLSEVKKILNGEIIKQRVSFNEQEMVTVVLPVEVNKKVAGALFLLKPIADITDTIKSVRRLIFLSSFPAMLLAIILALILSRSMTRPLKEMSAASRAMAGGDFQQRVDISSKDEVGELAINFNYLAEALYHTVSDLSKEKEKMENVLSNMAEGVIAVDLSYNTIAVNEQAVKKLGLESKEILSFNIKDYSLPWDVEDLFEQVLLSGENGTTEIVDDKKFILAHVSPLKESGGNIFGAVGVLHDISELRQLEQMRRDLVANVSHELRTPLTSISGFVEAMLDGTISSEEERITYLNIIHRETMRLNRLIHNLLDLAALESGKTDWEVHRVNINTLINRVTAKLKPQAEEKHVALNKDIKENIPMLFANEDRVEQVLTNLLDNAVYFSPPEGEVSINVRGKNKEVIISISDRGPGIPEEKLSYIWKRFQRADRSRSRTKGGTGLGLAIVKQIVEAHNGRVSVENRAGGGAVFSFTLPAADNN
ncbi:MAG: cell wall metabolism sensor histidine kinase WalK [Clostridiales bacterium]|nr:cell wall metabolism sensor histidine kinase WalK [Clostridiales bacterium]MCF8021796.1 cell wall metabolism sensor histidine kinase WalK [Clostridiales bacterium]